METHLLIPSESPQHHVLTSLQLGLANVQYRPLKELADSRYGSTFTYAIPLKLKIEYNSFSTCKYHSIGCDYFQKRQHEVNGFSKSD